MKETIETMFCTSRQEAARIALYGEKKMLNEGYKQVALEPSLPVDLRSAYRVENQNTGRSHAVNINLPACTCPFFADNSQYQVCKHIVFCRNEKAKDVAELQYQANEAAYIADLEARYNTLTDAGTTFAEEYGDLLEQSGRYYVGGAAR